MRTDPEEIIERLYHGHTEAMEILLAHSRAVAEKSLEIARTVPHLNPDLELIREAALLHDIGMLHTDAPVLGCRGELPYICHGVIGRGMLEKEGLEPHALVCERHVGVGLTSSDIREKGFPIPERDMLPLSVEEKIVCIADKFFSKLGDLSEKPMEEVRISIAEYGGGKLRAFDVLAALLGLAPQ